MGILQEEQTLLVKSFMKDKNIQRLSFKLFVCGVLGLILFQIFGIPGVAMLNLMPIFYYIMKTREYKADYWDIQGRQTLRKNYSSFLNPNLGRIP
jgi:hypothetical protein